MTVGYNLSRACKLLGYSRQAYYKHAVSHDRSLLSALPSMLATVRTAREACPTKGCRAMYSKYGSTWPIGRDKSIGLLMDYGYRVRYPKNYQRATQAGTRPFANLLVNLEVTGINQVWQSDMAHYLHGDRTYYTIYITDVYSQEVVGYGAYATNHAVNYAEVLERAIKAQRRFTGGLKGLIHHSDGGKQYESNVYGSLCAKHGIRQSMCIYSYENPYAEKTNDLINNGYLNVWRPKTLSQLQIKQQDAVRDHNSNNLKKKLGNRTPLEFKKSLIGQKNARVYRLQLKPVDPEQPRNKLLTLKPLIN
jgi:putative transposase